MQTASQLREALKKAVDEQNEQVARNAAYKSSGNSLRHPSHNDYAEGRQSGLQQAYDIVCKFAALTEPSGDGEAGVRILAERAYPGLKKSGFCSRSHENAYECKTCYPDLNRLIFHHLVVYDGVHERILAIAGAADPPNGRYGTYRALDEIAERITELEAALRTSSLAAMAVSESPNPDLRAAWPAIQAALPPAAPQETTR